MAAPIPGRQFALFVVLCRRSFVFGSFSFGRMSKPPRLLLLSSAIAHDADIGVPPDASVLSTISPSSILTCFSSSFHFFLRYRRVLDASCGLQQYQNLSWKPPCAQGNFSVNLPPIVLCVAIQRGAGEVLETMRFSISDF